MAQAAEPLRLFFALWPPEDLQARLAAWANKAAGKGRAMRQENIHMTLAFLGAADPALLPALTAGARAVRFAPMRLTLDRVGYWKHNRIIWCGIDDEPQALSALVAGLRAGLDATGIRYDPKPFVSHVTLVRNAAGLPVAPAWVPLAWEARDFALVVSNSVKGRVSYQLLQRFAAAAG